MVAPCPPATPLRSGGPFPRVAWLADPRIKRDFKKVYADVMFLGDLGLIELKEEGKRKTLIPIARFAGIEVDLGAGA